MHNLLLSHRGFPVFQTHEHRTMVGHEASSASSTTLRAKGIFNLHYTARLEHPKEEQSLSYQSRSVVLEKRDGASPS